MPLKHQVLKLNQDKNLERFIVACNVNPDLDGLACVYAYKEFLSKTGQEVGTMIFGRIHEEARYLLDRFKIHFKNDEVDLSTAKIIIVDSSDLRGIDKSINPKQVVEVIDHRQINDSHLFPNAKIQIELVGAAATLITEKFIECKISISFESAILLYGAIISNTLNFKSSTTTERDKKAVQYLTQQHRLPANLAEEMFLAKSDLSGDQLQKRINGDFAWFDLVGRKIGIAQIEMIGAENLVYKRKDEILVELKKAQERLDLDGVFLSAIELKVGFNIFVSDSVDIQKILTQVFGVEFVDSIAKRQGLIMRKEIVPLIKKYLDKN